MSKRGELERELIVAQQQRDRLANELERTARVVANLRRELAEARAVRPWHAPVTDPVRRWLDDIGRAVGL